MVSSVLGEMSHTVRPRRLMQFLCHRGRHSDERPIAGRVAHWFRDLLLEAFLETPRTPFFNQGSTSVRIGSCAAERIEWN